MLRAVPGEIDGVEVEWTLGALLHELLEPPLVMQARSASAGPSAADAARRVQLDEPIAAEEFGTADANMVTDISMLGDFTAEE